MADLITMPKMSDTMTEGVIVKWNVKVGDTVKSGDIMAEVETDKATMDMEVYSKGTVLHLVVQEGEAVTVDGPIAVVGKEGEDFQSLLSGATTTTSPATTEPAESTPVAAATPAADPVAASVPASKVSDNSTDGRLKASPLARKIAEEKGINLSNVQGTGENGRIVKRDLDNAQPAATAAPSAASNAVFGQESFTEVNVSQMRKTIAGRLAESKFNAPHFYLTIEINMDKAS